MGIILGLLGLLILLSFSTPNYCQLANNGFTSIEVQTQKAIQTHSLEMARYQGFKALNLLEKTKNILSECKCKAAIASAKDTEISLKNATRSKSLDLSKKHLKSALKNTLTTIELLDSYDALENDSILEWNVIENLNNNNAHMKDKLDTTIERSIKEFEVSLIAVVKYVDCPDALNFMNRIVTKSNQELSKSTLSQGQRSYHRKIKAIVRNKLTELNYCNQE